MLSAEMHIFTCFHVAPSYQTDWTSTVFTASSVLIFMAAEILYCPSDFTCFNLSQLPNHTWMHFFRKNILTCAFKEEGNCFYQAHKWYNASLAILLKITDTSYKNVKRNLQVIRNCVSTLVPLVPLGVIYAGVHSEMK